MKKIFYVKTIPALFILIFFSLYINAAVNEAHPSRAIKYAPGELFVKYRSSSEFSSAHFYAEKMNIQVIKQYNSIGWQHVKLPPTLDIPSAIEMFQKDPNVEGIEPNYCWTKPQGGRKRPQNNV